MSMTAHAEYSGAEFRGEEPKDPMPSFKKALFVALVFLSAAVVIICFNWPHAPKV